MTKNIAKWFAGKKSTPRKTFYNIYKKGIEKPVLAFVEDKSLCFMLVNEFGVHSVKDATDLGIKAKLVNNHQL